jgi:TPP-dependent pyruvate/acetoin dehydrogenase alpha subunit
LGAAEKKRIDEQVRLKVEETVKEFEEKMKIRMDAPFDHVFGTSHEFIEEQRRELLASLEEGG